MVSLCDSVDNERSNNSAAFHTFGPKNFLSPFGQKSMSQNFFFSAGGQKTLICQAILAISQDIGLKIETDFANFGPYIFLHNNDPNLFWILNLK